MTVRIALRHRIEFQYNRPVRLSTHWLRMRPAPGVAHRVSAYSLKIDARPHFINWVRDPFENNLARLDLPEPVPRLGLDLELIAELEAINPFDFLVEPAAANYPFAYDPQLHKELGPYLGMPRGGPRLGAFLASLDRQSAYIVAFLTRLNQQIHESVAGLPPGAPGPVDPEAVLARGAGTPWELAWLGTLALRSLGLAARFVSGYRVSLGDGPYAALHAWSEVYLPGAGWIGLDPAGGLFVDEGYLPLAAAPDPLRALPVVGYREACDEAIDERFDVRILVADAPQWPLDAAQWRDLQTLGQRIDTDLAAADIALTVAPSLAFVSAEAPGLDEWNTKAPGTDKRRVAERLMLMLRDRLAPGGVVQAGQGELFGGESAPRWRLGCWARADAVPVCRDADRIGWGQASDGLSAADAERFGRDLAQALGLSPDGLVPAFEDGLYRRWQGRAQTEPAAPVGALDDPEQRRRLAERLSLDAAVLRGYLLPLRWDAVAGGWRSGAWRMRRGAVYLMPGDSPMGYRLPLESLPQATRARIEPERCQFEALPPLASMHADVGERAARSSPGPHQAGDASQDPAATPRTAVCLEVREGRLHCFLPPLTHLEHYLDLVAAIEVTAEALDLRPLLEGYEPPEDHRLLRLLFEPDAGVLRVHLPAAGSSGALADMLQTTFQAADRCGLRGERITPDGGRFAPGVGAPLVLGGPSPARSPFLRRPAILRSLIACWQRHPSLSYLFAGRGIGASGNAPRVDEGRDEALYELAIALERLPSGETAEPWLADRVLRHLLADPAGDMRRAEIRVDELYDPMRPGRRLGRVTLGAFEMAPAAELASLQALLLRGLVARFARSGETVELREWGDRLYDEFLLPRLLWRDFLALLGELASAGYCFRADWFSPLIERRFPRLGRLRLGDVVLELRQALEPWPVLAEEVTAAGVARFLDSARDRVQLTAGGLTPGRHAIVCNGRRVPLQPTGVVGEYVAGVRFKATDPPATLHPLAPTVDVLEFDLVDTWSGRGLGGFSYRPAQPDSLGGMIGTAVSAAPDLGPRPPQSQRFAPVGLPVWQGRGQFEPRASAGRYVTADVESTDRARPYLLDLSFQV
jgi:uncharacterized protein (DUF2126 family)